MTLRGSERHKAPHHIFIDTAIFPAIHKKIPDTYANVPHLVLASFESAVFKVVSLPMENQCPEKFAKFLQMLTESEEAA